MAADEMSTTGFADDAAVHALADRLSPLVVQELPCDPSPEAVAEWVARGVEAGFTRAFAVNVACCVGPQCAPAILAELERRGADAGDRELVARALAHPCSGDLLRSGPMAPVLANALHAPADIVLQQVASAAREGGAGHARCVRLGHEVVLLFDSRAKLDWLFSGAKHKVRDALAKVGCDPRAALTQDVDLAQGGKLSLPGYEVVVTRRRGRLHAQADRQGVESPRARVTNSTPQSPTPEIIRQPWQRPALEVVGRIVRAVGAPVRVLRRIVRAVGAPVRVLNGVNVAPRHPSALAALALGYARTHRAGVAVAVCMAAALTCLGVVASDVYGNLSGEARAPRRPPGFYVGQYNKAGPWGADLRPYGLYVPPHFRGRPGPFPLIVYLHGYGERSPRQLFAAGLPMSIATRFGEHTKNGPFEFAALFPNDPTGYWDPASQEGRDAIAVLDYVIARHDIDPDRVYLTGASSGGAGVWRYAEEYPDRWAALAPLGAIYTPRPSLVKRTPAWIFHGERDEEAPVGLQRELFRRLKGVGGDVKITEYPGKAHTVSSETYDNTDLFTWFASKKR